MSPDRGYRVIVDGWMSLDGSWKRPGVWLRRNVVAVARPLPGSCPFLDAPFVFEATKLHEGRMR
jgi:hypothetical protein